MIHPQQDAHFREFISTLEDILAGHGTNNAAVRTYQLTKLTTLEHDFRTALVRNKHGAETYQKFIADIKNTLLARPYFRERDETFKASISPVLKEKDFRKLYRFNINFQFIQYVLRSRDWSTNRDGRKLIAIADKVKDIRSDLVECNLPLAISQAKGFWERNKDGHLEFMDFNQIGVVGLLEAVDKFVPTDRPNPKKRDPFPAVIIGRMLGNFIEDNSQTLVHFYPKDRRIIYRARKIIASLKDGSGQVDMVEVLRLLNRKEAEESDPQTTLAELNSVMAACQVMPALPAAQPDDGDAEQNAIERYAADDDCRPDVRFEQAEVRHHVALAIEALPMLDQKVLKLRGVDFLSA